MNNFFPSPTDFRPSVVAGRGRGVGLGGGGVGLGRVLGCIGLVGSVAALGSGRVDGLAFVPDGKGRRACNMKYRLRR